MSTAKVTRFLFLKFLHLLSSLTRLKRHRTVICVLSCYELLRANLIKELFRVLEIINPLSVASSSRHGDTLTISSLSGSLNVGILSVSIQIFDKGFHRFKFNLKSGYHHIEIFPAHRKFLSFSWDFGTGSLRHFQFSVLLFGLSSSPFIFTKKEKSLRSVS